jgi:hypothetical protein
MTMNTMSLFTSNNIGKNKKTEEDGLDLLYRIEQSTEGLLN